MKFGIHQFPRNDQAAVFADSGTYSNLGIQAMSCRLRKVIMLSLLHEKHPMLSQMILRQFEFQSVSCRRIKKLNCFLHWSLSSILKEAKIKSQEQQKTFLSCFSELLRTSHIIAPYHLCLS